MECYCTCITEVLSYFFILQSLTASKMKQFQPLKLSQFHKAKTCWTENSWSSGIMSNFLGQFFYVLGVKNLIFQIFFYIVGSALKSCLIINIFFLFKIWEDFFFKLKTGFFRAKYFLYSTLFLILGFNLLLAVK